MAQVEDRRKRIEASVKAVVAQLVREEVPGSGKMCNKAVIEKMIELNKSCTRKVKKSLNKRKNKMETQPTTALMWLRPTQYRE